MGEVFEEACPQYLAMGMSYEQFWDGESDMVISYRKAYELRQQEINNNAWLHGLYVWKALQCAPLFVNGFVPKGAKIEPYFDKPIDFTPPEKKPKPMSEREQKKKQAITHVEMLAARFNAQFARKRQAEQKKKNDPPGEE